MGRAPMGRTPYKSAKERGVGAISSISVLNLERPPMSCLQRLDALGANNWTNNIQQNH